MTNFELTMENGIVVMVTLKNVMIEEIDGTVSIHAGGGFLMDIPMAEIESHNSSDNQDTFVLSNGSRILIGDF